MERENINYCIYNYIDELRLAVRQPILERDVGDVDVDKAKVFFLLLPLLNGERWTDSTHAAAVAVGAVHIAFDAHDTIHHKDATSTLQQLTVLSGDYFSGIHYKILAALPDIDFIRSLSMKIGQINELKTNYYKRSPIDVNELFETVQSIETSCITDFLYTYGFSKYIPLASTALTLLALDSTMKKTTSRKIPDILDWKLDQYDLNQVLYSLRSKLDRLIDESDFMTPVLQKEILGMTAPLLGKMI
ncbi:heptaprenyl diphosphate synthase component 1 [Sporosarcina sp. Marseille-Q4063]|uniref:heptaprenyl diphosphate synthase component 1 n=1 Tax=Sporosarcina sp. Marseille-Q4063 TaxID=2810514 RepID=UPI001BAEA54C|nr:heptaprenyl diphosphate synthase component 1 [Sporosarcina sp. Marseille-Q4063]QUW22108.1 heptaprenyl diphosphate synthase component 1 [Sporosarcina sp. Marseille-Q4063]